MNKLLDYLEFLNFGELRQADQAKYLIFFHLKSKKQEVFNYTDLIPLFVDANLNKPNLSRLFKQLIDEKYVKKHQKVYKLTVATFQKLSKELDSFFQSEEIFTSETLLDEKKFTSKYDYIVHLIKQINCTYENKCFDATAVLMRRVFEICIILVYKKHGLDNLIRDNNGFFQLDKLITLIVSDSTINLSRIKTKFNNFQKIGNNAAHRLEYTTSKKDIDNIFIDYRTALEELFYKGDIKQ